MMEEVDDGSDLIACFWGGKRGSISWGKDGRGRGREEERRGESCVSTYIVFDLDKEDDVLYDTVESLREDALKRDG